MKNNKKSIIHANDVEKYLPESREYYRKFISSHYHDYCDIRKYSKVGYNTGYPNFNRDTEVIQHIRDIVCNFEDVFKNVDIPEDFVSPQILISTWANFYNLLLSKNELFENVQRQEKHLPQPFWDIKEAHDETLEMIKTIMNMPEVKDFESDDNFSSNKEYIGEYKIIKELGKGGFGCVYKVQKDTKFYALKICSDNNYIDRFKREIRLMESVKSPNVMPVLDSDLEDNPPYFVMPLCKGNLCDKNYNNKEINFIEDAIQICNGIKALHSNNNPIIHRDIKPANILTDEKDNIIISDLGLGRFEERDSKTLTKSNISMGTEGYKPPEFSIRGGTKNATVKSDIYQLGKTFYNLYTHNDPTYIEKDKLPNGLNYIISKCTNENSENRYQNIDELLDALTKHLDILKGNNNPLASFEREIEKLKSKQIKINDVYSLFELLYEFTDDPNIFCKNVKNIPNYCFKYLKNEDLKNFMDIYVKELNCLSLRWNDIDVIANQMKKIFDSTDDIEIRTNALRETLNYASSYTRYNAMNTFNSMLKSVEKDSEAANVASMLNENLDNYKIIISNTETLDELHPLIQNIRYMIIKDNKTL